MKPLQRPGNDKSASLGRVGAHTTIQIFMRLLWCQHPSWYISSLIWKGDSSHFLSLPQSGGRRVVMRLKIISILIFSDADQICVFLLKITKTLHMGHQGKSYTTQSFCLPRFYNPRHIKSILMKLLVWVWLKFKTKD